MRDFKVAGISLPNSDFVVDDGFNDSRKARSPASEGENDLPGTIGQNILSMSDVEYDLPGGAVRLMRSKDCANANLASWAAGKPVSLMDIEGLGDLNRHVAGALYLNGKRFRAIFNSGQPSTLISLRAAASLGLKPGDPNVVPRPAAGGLSAQRWVAPFDSVKLGDEEIRKTHLIIGELTLPDIDALIGADFFRAHRVYVATSLHRLFFTYVGGAPFDH